MDNFIPSRRGDNFKPRIVSFDPNSQRRELAKSVLPQGSTLAPTDPFRRQAAGFFTNNMPMGVAPYPAGGGGSSTYHMQRPYLPGVESPDRVQYPRSRMEANKAWRLFHETDPIFGTAIDMYAEMLVSDFDIVVGDEKSREIRDTLEYMCQTVTLVDRLKYFVREYLVLGECIPHCFFDDSLGIWTYIAMHNPDYIEVVDTPVVNMDPIINFIPDEELRRIMNDGSPEAREFRSRLPAEFVSKIMARQKIRLSNLNCSFVPRKMHPYQTRGTSIASRLWRIFMVEDAVYASTIATYRRHASPVKVLKLGDPQTGWIPAPGSETKLLEMLNRAEVDPQCFVPETPVTKFDGSQTPIGDLKVGDKLLDKDGKVCEVEVLQRETTDEIYELDIVGTPLIKCTPNHKWPVWGAPRHYCKNNRVPNKVRSLAIAKGWDPYQKLMASELRSGDYLMIPRKFEEKCPEDISLMQARLLGYYVAEGNTIGVYTREDGSVRRGFELSFNIEEENTFVKDASSIVKELCGYSPELFKGDSNNCQVRARRNASSDLADWLGQHGGRGSRTKRLSSEVMAWPLDLKYEFIKGYFAGDGSSIAKNNNKEQRYLEISSSSEVLINQTKLILAQLGTYGTYSNRFQEERSFGPGNLQHRLHVHGSWAAKLSLDVWNKNAVDPGNNTPKQWWVDSGYLYVKIRGIKVTECLESQEVFNMTVSGDHSYLTHCIGTRNSWLIYHYGINFEQWGTTDKAINIKAEHDVIERIKLLALGLSKSFMTGEVTFASAKSGLQVFLRRLLSLRQFIENIWLYPKFFRPISEINDWTTTSPSEVNHKYRIKRTAQEIQEQNLIMMPTLKWKNKLDPSVDQDLLNAYKTLEGLGLKLSKSTISSAVNVDWRDELEKSLKEFKTEEEMKGQILGEALVKKYEQQHAKPPAATPPGTPGAGAKPPGAAGKPPGGIVPGMPLGGMNDASRPPGSGGDLGAGSPLNDSIEIPEGGGLPVGM